MPSKVGPYAVGTRTLIAKTCLRCGELKQGSDFIKSKANYREPYCKPCRNLRCSALTKAYQETSIASAARRRTTLTQIELDEIRKMVAQGRTAKYIAKATGRTVYGVYNIKNRFRIMSRDPS